MAKLAKFTYIFHNPNIVNSYEIMSCFKLKSALSNPQTAILTKVKDKDFRTGTSFFDKSHLVSKDVKLA